jgi:hypothetical protein
MTNNIPDRAQKYLIESLNRGFDQDVDQEYYCALKEYYGGGYGYDNLPSQTRDSYEKIKHESDKTDTGFWDSMIGNAKPDKDLPKKLPSPGFGRGGTRGKKGEGVDKEGRPDNILFGDTEKDDWGLGHAAGAYAIGKSADTIADVLDATGAQRFGDMVGLNKLLGKNTGFFGDVVKGVASGAVSAVPGATSKLLRQVGDISGANWFDANLGNIGRSQMQLAAQGAGKPWTPLMIPSRSGGEVKEYDPEYQDKKARAQRQQAIDAAEEQERIKKYRGLGYNIP